ncbi:MAG TPA: TetR family transcriptional regulator [Streptosporangiaceae bacterium]|jgi:AcrR family transcriptional regulator|nr:TetR family transcriptional regulator [Streptosporangiaceae bacterium]
MVTAEAHRESCRAPGRRARKKRATRLALRAAAIDLAAERGFSNVTVEDIAEAADVSVRTFFNYFPSKEAAVGGFDPDFGPQLRAGLLALPRTMQPLDALRTVFLARLQAASEEMGPTVAERRDWLRRLDIIRDQPELMAAYAKYFAKAERELREALITWLDAGPAAEPYATLLAAAAMAVLRVAGLSWSRWGSDFAPAEITAAAFDTLARGFSTSPHGAHADPGSAPLFKLPGLNAGS